jgi:nitrogen regulatory protein P-II 1
LLNLSDTLIGSKDSDFYYRVSIFEREAMIMRPDTLIAMKRIEIVIEEEALGDLLGLCRSVDVRGYTFIKHAGGLGSRGERLPDDYALGEKNAVVILACEEKQAERIVTALRPKLKDFGGMCLVSDCEWVIGPAVSY